LHYPLGRIIVELRYSAENDPDGSYNSDFVSLRDDILANGGSSVYYSGVTTLIGYGVDGAGVSSVVVLKRTNAGALVRYVVS
jgi:hypothetical protein